MQISHGALDGHRALYSDPANNRFSWDIESTE